MSVYLIIDVKVLNPELYSEYAEKMPATVQPFGGRYLARGGQITALVGDWHPDKLIIVEFPDREHVKQWMTSPDYVAMANLRKAAAASRLLLVESSLENPPPGLISD